MRHAKLRGRIKEKFGSQAAFARAMEVDPSSLSSKLLGKTGWTWEEVARAAELLDFPLTEAHEYFEFG